MHSVKRIPWIAIAVLALCTLMIGIGIARAEPQVVEQKATHICLECIGIG